MSVVTIYVLGDLSNELFDARESSPSYGFLGNDVEPYLDLIHPGCISRSIVDVPSCMGCEPALDAWMLVGGIVVDHDMYIKFLRNIVFDMFEERQILLMPVSSLTLSKHLAVGNVECSKEGCRTVSLIVE